ncbi:MAG: mechanosensitive ion channel family protein [Candidatus Diapherotrites archaeon]
MEAVDGLIDSFKASVNTMFPGTYFGSTVEQYIIFFGILILFALLGKIVYYLMKNHMRKLTEKTKTELDDILIDIIEEPLVLLIVIIGLFIGFHFQLANNEFAWFFDRLIGMLIVIIVAWFAIRLLNVLIEHYLKPLTEKTHSKLDDQLIPVLSKSVKVAIIAIALILSLQNFGYDVTALIAGLGIGGLAVAFAAQETISNVFGGIAIFVDKPFTVGDRVKFRDLDATVMQVGLRTTRLQDFDNYYISVPNSIVSKEIITNVEKAKKRRVKFTLNLVYSTPKKKMEKAKELVKKAVSEIEGTFPEETKVIFDNFGSSSLDLIVIYYLDPKKGFLEVKDAVNFRIMDLFEKEKLEFAYPTQTVYLEK